MAPPPSGVRTCNATYLPLQSAKHIGVTILTFQGHMTSTINMTIRLYAISYWWSIGTQLLSQNVSRYSVQHMLTK